MSTSARSAVTPVSRLLFRRCPPAVPWLVVSVVVDTIDRLPRRARAHVGEEVWVLVPAFANADAPASPVGVTRMSRVTATTHHAVPRVVGAAVGRSRDKSVLCRTRGYYLLSHASAASGHARPKRIARDTSHVSAFASTQPVSVASFMRPVPGVHGEFSEDLSAEVGRCSASHKTYFTV